MSKETIIDGLKELVEYLEGHDFKIDGIDGHIFGSASIYISCATIGTFKENIKIMGSFKKSAGSELEATRHFGSSSIQTYIARSKICKKTVVGKKTIPAIPAQPEREEDIIEYKCPESFHDIIDNVEELVK